MQTVIGTRRLALVAWIALTVLFGAFIVIDLLNLDALLPIIAVAASLIAVLLGGLRLMHRRT